MSGRFTAGLLSCTLLSYIWILQKCIFLLTFLCGSFQTTCFYFYLEKKSDLVVVIFNVFLSLKNTFFCDADGSTDRRNLLYQPVYFKVKQQHFLHWRSLNEVLSREAFVIVCKLITSLVHNDLSIANLFPYLIFWKILFNRWQSVESPCLMTDFLRDL